MSEAAVADAPAVAKTVAAKKKRVQENAPIEMVPLSRINASRYPNYRKLSDNDHIESLLDSIQRNKLKQNLVSGIQPDGSLGLSCGFQRYEALERDAVSDVVDEFNKAMGYEPANDNFVMLSGATRAMNPSGAKEWRGDTADMRKSRRRIRDVSPEWAKKYDDALAAYLVPCQIKTYKNDIEALIDNMEENKLRNDPCLFDETARVIDLLAQGMSNGAVAIMLGKSPSTVTHYKRIADLLPYLIGQRDDYLKTVGLHESNVAPGQTPKQPSEEQAAFLRKMDLAIAELDRRTKLGEEDPCSMQFQQLRELSNLIDPAKDDKKIPVGVIFDVVAMTVRLGKDYEPTDDPAYDMSTFKARANDIISFYRGKVREAEAAAQAAAGGQATGTAAPTATGPALNVDVNKPEDAALLQSMTAATGETLPITPAAATQGSGITPPTDAERQAKIDAANAPAVLDSAAAGQASHTSDDMIDDADAGMSSDDLMSNIAVPSIADLEAEAGKVPTAPDDGQMRARTGEANRSRYTALAPEKVESLADVTLKDMADPAQAEVVTPFDALGWMSAAKQLYYVIGLNKKSEAVNEQLVVFSEALGSYLAELEKLVAELPIEKQTKAKTLKPAIPTVTLPQD